MFIHGHPLHLGSADKFWRIYTDHCTYSGINSKDTNFIVKTLENNQATITFCI